MQKQFINPEALPNWSNMFTQVVVVEQHGLRFIHLSEQAGVDREKQLAGGIFRSKPARHW